MELYFKETVAFRNLKLKIIELPYLIDLFRQEQMITIGSNCARLNILIPNGRENKFELNLIKNSKFIFFDLTPSFLTSENYYSLLKKKYFLENKTLI